MAAVPGWSFLQPGAQPPSPLLTLVAVSGPGAVLPGYVHLTGAVPRPAFAWAYGHTIRATPHRDTYTPLTAPDWQPGDPTTAPQMDRRDPA